jgi:hypothetical protein
VFLQLHRIGLSGVNRAYLHLVKPTLMDVFIEKLTAFSMGNSVPDAPDSNKMVFFQDIHVFLQLS